MNVCHLWCSPKCWMSAECCHSPATQIWQRSTQKQGLLDCMTSSGIVKGKMSVQPLHSLLFSNYHIYLQSHALGQLVIEQSSILQVYQELFSSFGRYVAIKKDWIAILRITWETDHEHQMSGILIESYLHWIIIWVMASVLLTFQVIWEEPIWNSCLGIYVTGLGGGVVIIRLVQIWIVKCRATVFVWLEQNVKMNEIKNKLLNTKFCWFIQLQCMHPHKTAPLSNIHLLKTASFPKPPR